MFKLMLHNKQDGKHFDSLTKDRLGSGVNGAVPCKGVKLDLG